MQGGHGHLGRSRAHAAALVGALRAAAQTLAEPRAARLTLIGSLALAASLATATGAGAASWLEPWTLAPATSTKVGVQPAVAIGPGGEVAEASWSEGGLIVAGVRAAGSAVTVQEAVSPAAAQSSLPSVAVNAAGAVAVAWANDTAEQYEVAIRPPGGTFATPVAAGSTGGALLQRPPSLAIDDGGDVLIGEIREVSGGDVDLYGWMPAGGAPATTTLSSAAEEAVEPSVALDGAGDAVVAWCAKHEAVRDIARAITRPAGGVFGAVQELTDGAEYAFAQHAAIGAGGQAAVVWQRGLTAPPYHIEASTSAGPADLLSVPTTISPAASNNETPAVAVGGDGQVVAAWQHFGATSVEEVASGHAGGSFEASVEASASGSFGDPQVASDAAGDAVLAWGGSAFGTEDLEAVTRSAGGTLSSPVVLSAPEEKVDYGIFDNIAAASVGMDGAGDAVVGWEHAADHSVIARVYDVSPPTVTPSVPASAIAGQPVRLTAAAGDPFSSVTATTWSFGDGGTADGATLTHTYASSGTYTVTVWATDAAGNTASASRQLTVQAAPVIACAASAALRACPSCGAAAGPGAAVPACFVPVCRVPHLKGLGRKAAASRLQAAECRLGKVKIPRRYRRGRRLVVATQSVRAGQTLAFGASVAVTLGPAPPAHRRKHRRR